MKPIFIATLLLIFYLTPVFAEDAPPTPLSNKAAIELVQTHANYVWTMIATALVFFM